MSEEEMIQKCPDIVKVTPQIINQAAIKHLGHVLDFNLTFAENGLNDLDVVEMIMEFEKILDIDITDDIVDAFIKGKPPVFTQWLRNDKIEKLGL